MPQIMQKYITYGKSYKIENPLCIVYSHYAMLTGATIDWSMFINLLETSAHKSFQDNAK